MRSILDGSAHCSQLKQRSGHQWGARTRGQTAVALEREPGAGDQWPRGRWAAGG